MRHILLALTIACVLPSVSAAQTGFREEEVTFRSGTVTLAGTLTIPAGTGPFRAVVLLSGSGLQDRDSNLLGFRPFKIIAEHLGKLGIAVLRCDDRGVGGSTGSYASSTTEEFADDALAAVAMLGQRADILKSRIGLVGHSEGAITAAIAAAKSPDVAFIVWMAGSAVPGAEILQMQAASVARAGGATPEVVNDIVRRQAALVDAVAQGSAEATLITLGQSLAAAQIAAMPEAQRTALGDNAAERLTKQSLAPLQSRWMQFFVRFDPATALKQITCPVLAVFGGLDVQVPFAPNRKRLVASLAETNNLDLTVTVYPEANHLFMRAVTGQLAEYATLPKTFVPALLDDIAGWLARR